ncbi:MAG TPA: deoxyribonuclease V [Planctomycetaceae bacterium]|nr:deoxyribonuclease V [Planctomycetaceae bacterium]
MRVRRLHKWNLRPEDAAAVQSRLARHVVLKGAPRTVQTIGGADVAYDEERNLLFAGIVVLERRSLERVERSGAVRRCRFPYVPGLLSFRECPALLAAAAKIRCEPDVLMVDSQGVAHPRRFGLASHLGLLLDCPTIGCAKSWLIGQYDEPGSAQGGWSPLWHGGRQVGAVVRTRERVKPVFVSPGHRMTVRRAVRLVLETTRGYRLPEPVRQAHLFVGRLRREHRSARR